MFSRIWTKPSTKSCSEQIERLKVALQDCDAVVIGAGSGLSTAADFTYTGERFEKYFSDFAQKYGIQDMYSGGFYPFPTQEEFWAYWSRYIFINRYQDAPKPVYEDLLKLIQDKDYFVITTNVDHCFQKAGFDKKRLFYTQGDYGLFQCSEPCCQETFDNETVIREMFKRHVLHFYILHSQLYQTTLQTAWKLQFQFQYWSRPMQLQLPQNDYPPFQGKSVRLLQPEVQGSLS